MVSLPKHFAGKGELDGEKEAHAALTARGVPHLRSEVGSDPLALLRILAPDVVFRQSQWDHNIDPRLSTANLALHALVLGALRDAQRHHERLPAPDEGHGGGQSAPPRGLARLRDGRHGGRGPGEGATAGAIVARTESRALLAPAQ